ncbi:MAG: hypothetical protein ABII12_17900 [Planctomycetota bacterium]
MKMNGLVQFLSGKKTYLVAAITVGVSVAASAGVVIPVWVYAALIAVGGATGRAAIQKAYDVVKEAGELKGK